MSDWTDVENRLDQNIRDSALAEPVVYTSFGGTARSVRGVFSPTTLEIDAETSALIRSNKVMLSLRVSDLEFDPEIDPSDTPGVGDEVDEVIVRGVTYRVVDIERVGLDWVDLRLHVKAP